MQGSATPPLEGDTDATAVQPEPGASATASAPASLSPGELAAPMSEQAAQPAVQPARPPVAGEERYDFERCTIVLVAQLRPVKEVGKPRMVLLSVANGVGNKEDLPIYRLLPETELGGPWPPVFEALLEELRQDLPHRRARHAARQAGAKAAPANTTRPVGKPATTMPKRGMPAAKAPPPPLPTTSSPIPKGELTIGGLFDDVD